MPPTCRPSAPTAVASLLQTSFGTAILTHERVLHAVLSGGHTQHHPLSVRCLPRKTELETLMAVPNRTSFDSVCT